MATPWEDPIKKGKVLTIFAGPDVANGVWKNTFPNAISEFNKLSQAHKLGVTFQQGNNPPDPKGVGGADVQFAVGDGSVKFTSIGTEINVSVSGTSLIGNTEQVLVVVGNDKRIAKAFIVLPATPQINMVKGGDRDVGDGVKLVMAVHEFVHACGLTNADHSPDDLFFGYPQPRVGSTPADDKVEVKNGKRLPPLILSAQTVSLIQKNWK
jgi:hypothetical protein